MRENDDNRDVSLRLDTRMLLKLFRYLPPEERGYVVLYAVEVFLQKYPIHPPSQLLEDSDQVEDDELVQRDLDLCLRETMPQDELCEYLEDYIHLVLEHSFPDGPSGVISNTSGWDEDYARILLEWTNNVADDYSLVHLPPLDEDEMLCFIRSWRWSFFSKLEEKAKENAG